MIERLQIKKRWRGRAVLIRIQNDETAADIHLLNKRGSLDSMYAQYSIVESPKASSLDAAVIVATNQRLAEEIAASFAAGGVTDSKVATMWEGQANGLEKNPGALSGRHALTKAISLAVHLGASRIYVEGTRLIGPRTMRNLETMFRPLKGHRVRLATLDGDLPGVERAESTR